jgi:hypothetical protein
VLDDRFSVRTSRVPALDLAAGSRRIPIPHHGPIELRHVLQKGIEYQRLAQQGRVVIVH